MKYKQYLILMVIIGIFCSAILIRSKVKPSISIITSLYNADEFIEEFLKDIARQTVFDKCELLIINANSPGNEESIIQEYVQQYSNIIYKRLEKDPGIYAVWNIGILMARGQFITNANVDDRLAPNCYEKHLQALLEHPEVDLVYSDFYLTFFPNETFEHNRAHVRSNWPEFSPKQLIRCNPPHCNPMWRRLMHQKYGFFDEKLKYAGDWEMWLRAVENRAIFLKIDGVYVLYYENPNGLSTDKTFMPKILEEHRAIREKYLKNN